MFGVESWVFWFILAAVFLVAEIMTVNLVTIWFFAGSLCALLASAFGLGTGVQIGIFFISSILFVVFFWNLRDRLSLSVRKASLTNADRIVGQQAVVTTTINVIEGSGQIKVMGQSWSAVTADRSIISVGECVTVIAIKGVKAVVEKK